MQNSLKLCKEDLSISCKEMALYLLGKLLVRKLDDGTVLKGKIVETECYLGNEDKASHSHNGRRTPANEPMYMPAGTAFVYMTYGMYYCFNVSSIEPGAAVLLRALQPTHGVDVMKKLRLEKRKGKSQIQETDLCNGPSKLCMSMGITKDSCNKIDMCSSDVLWLEDDDSEDKEEIQVVTSTRIGIASVGPEWAQKPLRFYVLSNPHVSKRDRKAEKDLTL